MTRLAHFVLNRRKRVMLFWLLVFVGGIIGVGPANDRLTIDFSLPGQPGYETEKQLLDIYGNGGSNAPYIAVVTVPPGTTVQEQQDKVDTVFDAIRAKDPTVRVADFSNTQDKRFITSDNRTTFALIFAPLPEGFGPGPEKALDPVLEQQAKATGLETSLTGYNLLAQGGDSEGPSVFVETLFGAFGALLVLIFVFASLAAAVPLIIAAVSILATFLVVLVLTTIMDVSFI